MKLNKIAYNKLVLQAQEAKELGLNELADVVLNSIGPTPRDEKEAYVYSSEQLQDDMNKFLWKMAISTAEYHDLKSLDIQKIDEVIKWAAKQVLADLESCMDGGDGISRTGIGPLEPKLPGESK